MLHPSHEKLHRTALCRTALYRVAVLLLVVLISACDSTDTSATVTPGTTTTGVGLSGTVSENRVLASNTVEIKASTGERFTSELDNFRQFSTTDLFGSAPYLVRADLGNSIYRYAIAYSEGVVNVNSYSDVLLRDYYVGQGQDIDNVFNANGEIDSVPALAEFDQSAESLFSVVQLALEFNFLSAEQLLNEPFAANNTGADKFLNDNPIQLGDDDGEVSVVLTDPVSNTQSTNDLGGRLGSLFAGSDATPPKTPIAVRSLGASPSQIIVVWEPSEDDIGILGYQVFRDSELITTTPYPVYTDTGLERDSLHSYQIVALDTSGNTSNRSIAVSGRTLNTADFQAPPAPTNFIELSVSVDRVELIWRQAEIGDVVSFNVFRGAVGQTLEPLVQVTATGLIDNTVNGGTEYCYRVSAVDASGNESPNSDLVCTNTGGESVMTDTAVATMAGLVVPDIRNLECPIEIGGTIEVDTQLSEPCYSVTSSIVLADFVNLTITAGTVMKFATGANLFVDTFSSLTITGTAEQPVILTGEQEIRGYWGGVHIKESDSTRNLISHTVIEYAGDQQGSAGLYVFSSLLDAARIRVENSLFRFNDLYGFSFDGLGMKIDSFTGNVSTENRRSGAASAGNLEPLGGANDFQNNDINVIGSPRANIGVDLVLPRLNVPIETAGIIARLPTVTIEAGAEIWFRSGAILYVESKITAQGSPDNPILLRGSNPIPGQWAGVNLSGSTGTVLEYVTIENGGFTNDLTASASNLNLSFSSASLRNVTLRNSSGTGFRLNDSASSFTVFENVVNTGNMIP